MIKIYTSPSCSSCRKVKKWFEEQKIPYVEKNIFSSVLNPDELKEILAKSEITVMRSPRTTRALMPSSNGK